MIVIVFALEEDLVHCTLIVLPTAFRRCALESQKRIAKGKPWHCFLSAKPM